MIWDIEIQNLHARMRLHDTYKFRHPDNHKESLEALRKEYARVSQFPLSEVSEQVWNKMDLLATRIGIKSKAYSLLEDEESDNIRKITIG